MSESATFSTKFFTPASTLAVSAVVLPSRATSPVLVASLAGFSGEQAANPSARDGRREQHREFYAGQLSLHVTRSTTPGRRRIAM